MFKNNVFVILGNQTFPVVQPQSLYGHNRAFTYNTFIIKLSSTVQNNSNQFKIAAESGIGCFLKFHLIVGVEESIVNGLSIQVTDQLFQISKSSHYIFTI
jgi:hypothetical protein